MAKHNNFTSLLLAAGLFCSGLVVQAQEFSVKLTTSKAVGSEVVFVVNNTYEGVTVDWGDGQAQVYKTDDPMCEIKGSVKGATITIAGAKSWDMLVCADAGLTNIDLSGAKHLRSLYCQNNELTGLDLRGMTALTDLNCANNAIQKLTFTATSAPEKDLASIETINVSGNQLSGSFNVKASSLRYIDVSNNAYTSVQTTSNVNLDYLKCNNNQLSRLDLKAAKGLTTLVCNDNKINTLLFDANAVGLQQVFCDNNALGAELDLSLMDALKDFSCANNELAAVNLSRRAELFTLNASNNKMDFRILPRSANRPAYLTFMPQQPYDISAADNVKKVNGIPYIEVVEWADRTAATSVINLNEQARIAVTPDNTGSIEGVVKWYSVDIDGNVKELVARTSEAGTGDYYLSNRKTAFFAPQRQVYAVITADKAYKADNFYIKTTPISVGQDQATDIGIIQTPDADGLQITVTRGMLSMTSNKPVRVSVFAADGKNVWNGTVGAATTVSLPSGIYIVNGKKVAL